MTFSPGDKVTVNGLPATIKVYDEVVNQLVYTTPLPGGAENTTYAHISNSDVRPIEYVEAPQADELPLYEDHLAREGAALEASTEDDK